MMSSPEAEGVPRGPTTAVALANSDDLIMNMRSVSEARRALAPAPRATETPPPPYRAVSR